VALAERVREILRGAPEDEDVLLEQEDEGHARPDEVVGAIEQQHHEHVGAHVGEEEHQTNDTIAHPNGEKAHLAQCVGLGHAAARERVQDQPRAAGRGRQRRRFWQLAVAEMLREEERSEPAHAAELRVIERCQANAMGCEGSRHQSEEEQADKRGRVVLGKGDPGQRLGWRRGGGRQRWEGVEATATAVAAELHRLCA
jgi:hypothetical protein